MTTETTTDPIDEFLRDLDRQEVSPATLRNYRSDLSGFARWFSESTGEAFTPGAVTPTDIRDYKSHLISVQQRALATVNRRLAALGSFFRWAKGQRLVHDLPTDGVKSVAATPRAPHALTKREVDRLLRVVERGGKKRDLAVVLTLRHTGLRVGELCALTRDDLELGERKGQVTVRSGKGNKYRIVPLNVDARRALTAYLEVRPAVDDPHLFIGQRGAGLSPQAVQNLVGKYARQAGLEDVTPHTLRHSFAKQLLDSGVDLVTVSNLLGHERLDTTAIYTQPSARDLAQAVERLVWEGGTP